MTIDPERALEARKERMLTEHLAARGIRDAAVLNAIRAVPREAFLPPGLELFAYDDGPLPIAEGQTISQPYIVAYMVEALELRGQERVLEIGTGSGYAAAVLSLCAKQVHTVERLDSLAETARARLRALGYENVAVHLGDGTMGWPEHAPYDAIVVTAGAPGVPRELLAQLAPGGAAGDTGRADAASAGTGAGATSAGRRAAVRGPLPGPLRSPDRGAGVVSL